MREGLTEVVFILDRSGSMGGLEKDTIGGFNSLIEKQKKEEGEAFISTILFDNVSEVLHDRVPIHRVPKMTEEEYSVRGCTALLDAVGDAIRHIGNVHKYAREEDRPAKTLFIITTDGMENSSHRYTQKQVKEMVERQKEKYGWEFLFLGANIDAVAAAETVGIGANRSVRYECDEEGTLLNFDVLSRAVGQVRRSAAMPMDCMEAALNDDWADDIRRDYEGRGKKKQEGKADGTYDFRNLFGRKQK